MHETHSHERRQFESLFKQEAIDRFEDRFRILEVFLQTEDHLTSRELLSRLKEQDVDLPLEFVEETLELMCRFGFAQKNRFDNGSFRYEHRHLGQHHDHMICTKCGKIIEFKNDQIEQLQALVAAGFGFHMLQHRLEIYGLCSDCMKSREKRLPLMAARQGERVMIKDMVGGSQARMRLLSMGLRIGDILEVITNNGQGQLVVAVDYQRFVLGRGMSQKIIVGPPDEKEKSQTV